MPYIVVATKFAHGRCEKTDLHLLANNISIPKYAFFTKYLQSADKHNNNNKTTVKQHKNHIGKLEDCE